MKTLSKIALLIITTAFLTSCSKDDSPSSDNNSGGTSIDDDFVMGVTNSWVDEDDEFHTFFFQNSDSLGGFAGQENLPLGGFLLGTTKGFNFNFTLITQSFETIKYTGIFTDTAANHRRLLLHDPDNNPLYLRPQ
jgi:hypothetical protein